MKVMFITANKNNVARNTDYAFSLKTVFKVSGRKV